MQHKVGLPAVVTIDTALSCIRLPSQMGTVSTLSPVRTTGSLRGFLGGLARAITPVRRSARKKASSKPLEAMLEETGFSYGACGMCVCSALLCCSRPHLLLLVCMHDQACIVLASDR